MEVNKENLENALSNAGQPEVPKLDAAEKAPTKESSQETPQMPKEMEIGFHQGALNTLAAERVELIKIVQNVEKIMGMHIQRLGELGVKVQTKKE